MICWNNYLYITGTLTRSYASEARPGSSICIFRTSSRYIDTSKSFLLSARSRDFFYRRFSGKIAHPSIRGTSVRILLITSSLCWCVAGADCNRNGRQRPPRSRTATKSRTGANSRHLLRGLSSLRSLLLPLLGESSHGGGSRTVPLQGATSGSSVRHVVWKRKSEIDCWHSCLLRRPFDLAEY